MTAVEKAYLDAIVGISPVSLGLATSSQAFRELVEYFVVLFSSRSSWQSTHIPARYLVDWDIALRYFYAPGSAEAQLESFSWRWRYAVMYCVAAAILGHPKPSGTISSLRPACCEAFPFRDFLYFLPPEARIEVIKASRSWPESLQMRLWLAVKLIEGRTWDSPNSLRVKCQ